MNKSPGIPVAESGNTTKVYANIDLKKNSSVVDVSLGDEVTITVKGKVVAMRGPEESIWTTGKGKDEINCYPGNLKIEVSGMKIGIDGEFEAMLEDDS